MNRSRRRATVISWAIAAGVLYGGVGGTVALPAWADPTASGEAAGPGATGSGARDGTNAAGPRRPRVRDVDSAPSGPTASGPRASATRAELSAVGTAANGTESDGTDDRPCHWWPVIWPINDLVIPLPTPAVDTGGWIAVQDLAAVSSPIAQLADGAGFQLPALDIATAPPLPAVAPPAPAAPPAAVVAPMLSPPGQAGADQPAVAPLAGPSRPSSGPSVPRSPNPAGPPPESVRLGYPEYLRQADITEMAAVALPGLAAILGLTALGGLLGYRQARAGYLVRAAGAGRFLP